MLTSSRNRCHILSTKQVVYDSLLLLNASVILSASSDYRPNPIS
jgi:hypothetical protein